MLGVLGRVYGGLALLLDDYPDRPFEGVWVEVGEDADLVEGREDALLVALRLVVRAFLECFDGPVHEEMKLHGLGWRDSAPVLYFSEACGVALKSGPLPTPDMNGGGGLLHENVEGGVEKGGV